MKLADLLAALPDAQVNGPIGVDIRNISIDSRSAGSGDLFVALRGGEERDRHAFVPDAVSRGVSAVLLEDELPVGSVARVRVKDVKRALALVANRFYREPWRGLRAIGVTGTSGKTTTTFLIKSILDAAGIRTGRIGTHHNVVGGKVLPSHNTTPFAHDVFRLLREMADAGDTAVVMEVTSHALALDRVYGIPFGLGLFTNITRDHLNFHGTPEAYFEAKALLFERLGRDSVAVLNTDDPASRKLATRTAARVLWYGWAADAAVRPLGCVSDWQGTRMQVATPRGTLAVSSNLRGPFNVSNLLAAVAAGEALGVPAAHISQGLRSVQVPGRFENVEAGQPFAVIVDFAHKPDALEKVLAAARSLTKGKLVCVFGCGGDRDRGKRPIMGALSAERADLTIVTSDNPRTEDPAAIVKEVVGGVPASALAGSSARAEAIVDRRQAIRRALLAAHPGDVVLIAGKGDEDYQEVEGVRYPFDDKVVAAELIAELGLSARR
jgi:UDP-N-acetylmuramoyl-L-alanyl-D-glutamate--2,6-diaminopimelate ligase